jgi:hypothetical protein
MPEFKGNRKHNRGIFCCDSPDRAGWLAGPTGREWAPPDDQAAAASS